jgi:hypothetical protein
MMMNTEHKTFTPYYIGLRTEAGNIMIAELVKTVNSTCVNSNKQS